MARRTNRARQRISSGVGRGVAVVSAALALTFAFTGSVLSTSAAAATSSATAPVKRASECPTATVSVSTAAGLKSALAAARPGSVIAMAPGRYLGDFTVTASGTDTAPIWLCGPRSAVLTGGSYTTGHALTLQGVKNVVATGFSVDQAFKGVTVIAGNRVSVTDLSVTNIGYEAVHLRAQTVDSSVAYNTISHTGLVTDKYGEGVYLGTSDANWCKYNNCQVDRSDRNLVRGNIISDTGAQAIEAKEGTSSGWIEDNVITDTSRLEAGARSLITVKGNGYTITGNNVTTNRAHAMQTINSDNGAWGQNNTFAANTVVSPDDGIWVHKISTDPRGNRVACSNVSKISRMTNVTCYGTAAPAVTIVSPTTGSTVSGTVNLSSSATSTAGIVAVKYYVGNRTLGNASLESGLWRLDLNTSSLPAGTHEVYAKAFDSAGAIAVSKPVRLTLRNS